MVPFEEDVQGFLRQILEALDFIHDRNIAHLDIKVLYYNNRVCQGAESVQNHTHLLPIQPQELKFFHSMKHLGPEKPIGLVSSVNSW